MTGTCSERSGMGENSRSRRLKPACGALEDDSGEALGFSENDDRSRGLDGRFGERIGEGPSCKGRLRVDGEDASLSWDPLLGSLAACERGNGGGDGREAGTSDRGISGGLVSRK
jgi:hypothetical protein